MNRGLFIKSLRELAPATALMGALLLLVEMVLQIVLPRVADQVQGQMMQLPFAQNMVKAMLGTDTLPGMGPQLFQSFAWSHPVVMALVWAHAIIGATRLPAGEIDRGTIDILMGMPASRWTVFVSDSAAWAISGIALLLAGLAGSQIGAMTVAPDQRAALVRLAIVMVNLAALYAAVGAFAWLMSALCDRRGKAMTAAFIVVLGSFLLNFLAQMWTPMERFGFLSVLTYYRPLFLLNDGNWPWGDLAVLGGIAGALWVVAGVVFSRRDLSTI